MEERGEAGSSLSKTHEQVLEEAVTVVLKFILYNARRYTVSLEYELGVRGQGQEGHKEVRCIQDGYVEEARQTSQAMRQVPTTTIAWQEVDG
ncbi:MAG: hypothetical protein QXT64_02440 [Desulfurococcaceae archaeon]